MGYPSEVEKRVPEGQTLLFADATVFRPQQ